jgi:glycosyltransferase involved in cell wall biosynthesis
VAEGSSQSSATAIGQIAICTVGELFGGVERHVLGAIAGLAGQGTDVLLMLFHDGELAAQARAMGTDPVILPTGNLAALTTARRLASILDQRGIKVVHVHGYKATVFCAIARRWHPFAVVKTEHGLPEPMTGNPFRVWRDRLYHLVDDVATRAARAAVCYVTEDLREHHQHAHAGLRTTAIPNGVESMDRRRFPRPPELRADCFNLLIVGRVDLVKGHHLAIEALAMQQVPADVHLHILGEGPRRLELTALAAARGIRDRVHLLGFRRNAYDYIANCDGLLMPSLHEGLPYTLLEGMALGVPVIASRVGGLAEVVSDGTTGILIQRGDVAELAAAMLRLHQDPALGARLGDAGQRLQRARYSLDSMTAAYLEVYGRARLAVR